MIMYTNAQYTKDINGNQNGIKVDISGVTSFVPLDPANTDYIKIMALVQEGNLTIAPAS